MKDTNVLAAEPLSLISGEALSEFAKCEQCNASKPFDILMFIYDIYTAETAYPYALRPLLILRDFVSDSLQKQ